MTTESEIIGEMPKIDKRLNKTKLRKAEINTTPPFSPAVGVPLCICIKIMKLKGFCMFMHCSIRNISYVNFSFHISPLRINIYTTHSLFHFLTPPFFYSTAVLSIDNKHVSIYRVNNMSVLVLLMQNRFF